MSAIRPQDLHAALSETPSPLVIDVRSAAEFAAGTIAGARNLPWSDGLAERLASELPRDVRVIFVCGWGHRSVVATIGMRREGFRNVAFLDGGLEAWGLAGKPLVRAISDAEPGVRDLPR